MPKSQSKLGAEVGVKKPIIDSKISPYLVGGFLLFLAFSSNSDEEKRPAPYVYIDWVALGEGYTSTFDNEFSYSAIGVINKKLRGKRFPEDGQLCTKVLNNVVKHNDVEISIRAYNSTLKSNDTKLRHVKFRCLKFLGKADQCMNEVDQKVRNILKEKKLSMSEGATLMLAAMEVKDELCKVKNVVSETKYFHLLGYEDDKVHN